METKLFKDLGTSRNIKISSYHTLTRNQFNEYQVVGMLLDETDNFPSGDRRWLGDGVSCLR